MKDIGSIWNKWDLHIHSDASDGKMNCQEIIDKAKEEKLSVIALTDHHTVKNIDKIKELAKLNDIIVLSGIEFRTEYGQKSVHMIGLFPDNYNDIDLDGKFLTENILNPLGLSESMIIQKGKEADGTKDKSDEYYFKKGIFLVQVDFKTAANLIHQYGGIVTVHAGSKSNSIDEEMKHDGTSKKNVSIYDSLGPVKDELFKGGYIDICEIRNEKDGKEFYKSEFCKPSITASDAHEKSVIGLGSCWVKAEKNFNGLKQILNEPERVNFNNPEILERVESNPLKFIKQIKIKRTANATMNEIWYDNIEIELNPGLVAIIGNKGSGKSAITDIISLCANTHNDEFSFLNKYKFRSPKPYDRSKQIQAQIVWADNSCSDWITLDSSCDKTIIERVKYIPQSFLESLCVTEDDKQFEDEIKKIIFQHTPLTDRYGKNTLDEIIQYLSSENSNAERVIKNKIEKQNLEIIELEKKKTAEFKNTIENLLKNKEEELVVVQSQKPEEVKKPIDDENVNEQKQSVIKSIENISREVTSIQQRIDEYIAKRTELNTDIQNLSQIKQSLVLMQSNISQKMEEHKSFLLKYNLDINEVVKVDFRLNLIEDKIKSLTKQRSEIVESLDGDDNLYDKKKKKEEEKKAKENELNGPERMYQKYLSEIEKWNKRCNDILGDDQTEDTINYYKKIQHYINNNLEQELKNAQEMRNNLVQELVDLKKITLSTYNKLYAPVLDFVERFKDKMRDYPIQFSASFIVRDFSSRFFDIVSQSSAGSFNGKEQGFNRLNDEIDHVDFNDSSAILHFTNNINTLLLSDVRDNMNNQERDIESQLKKGHTKQELYDYIYQLDYIQPSFQLMMGDKQLPALSPGERGALLLLFYLFIDMDDKPLIIDQPEENLDNESVYNYLVHFIKEAKQKRQIIIVTHNPNLAVVCDADQIVEMKIDKSYRNKVSFQSGAIENSIINDRIVTILEGTYPAFNNRDCKYSIVEHKL